MGSYTIVCALLPVIILAMCQAESHSARLTAFGKSPNQNTNNPPKQNTLAVRSTCITSGQCTEGSECRRVENSTITSKICLCKDGFEEHAGWCSGAFKMTQPARCLLFTQSCLIFALLIKEVI